MALMDSSRKIKTAAFLDTLGFRVFKVPFLSNDLMNI